MDSIGATAQNSPTVYNSYIAEDSPVLSQKPIFFANDPPDAIIHETEEWNPDYWDSKTPDDFKQKVRQRKLQGFIGTEYTPEEAMSKQFGPEQIEARAFLEYYWEMKAKCLEAVEKKRNSEVETFQRNPLFSPDWLLPSKRDIRWYLKNEIRNEKKEVDKEENLNGSESRTLREEETAEKSSSVHKGIPDTRKVDSQQHKPVKGKTGLPLKVIRKPVVISNSSAVSLERFVGTKNLETRESQPKTVERKNGMKMKLTEIRKPVVISNSSAVSLERFIGTRNLETSESQPKTVERKNGMKIKHAEIRKPVVISNSSAVSLERFVGSKNLETRESQLKPVERKNGYKMKLAKIRKPVVISNSSAVSLQRFEGTKLKPVEGKNGYKMKLAEIRTSVSKSHHVSQIKESQCKVLNAKMVQHST